MGKIHLGVMVGQGKPGPTLQKKRRILFGLLTMIALAFSIFPVASTLSKFNYNANYGSALKSLIDRTVVELEAKRTEPVLEEFKTLQSKFYPTYENKGNFDSLINEATERMKEHGSK